MTPRQARTERRTAERKAKKAEMRRDKEAGLAQPDRSPEQDFSAKFIAESRATRERIDREVALKMAAHRAGHASNPSSDREGASANPGFVPKSAASAAVPDESDFIPLHMPTADERAMLDKLKAQRKAEINRANAQHSTGPRTPTGKLASSGNSLKHGLASGHLIIPGEDPSAFEALLAALLGEHQPAGPTEELLINEMAQSYWLSQRALRLQNECFTDEGVDDKRLSLYMRYHSTHERAFHKALTALMKLKKEQARAFQFRFVSQRVAHVVAKSGFVSQPVAEPVTSTPKSEFVPQKEHAEAA